MFFLCSLRLLFTFWKVFTPCSVTHAVAIIGLLQHGLILGTMVISVLCLSVKSSVEGKSVLLIAHEHAVSIRTLFEFSRVCNDPRLRRCARSGKKAGHEDYAPISFAAAWPMEDGIINSPFPDMLILSG